MRRGRPSPRPAASRELGCPADWAPACLRPWLQDPGGDGTYPWVTKLVPAGGDEFKVAHRLAWDENDGAGGVPAGSHLPVSMPDGATVTFSHDSATHVASATVS